jgi:hypothetical protein
MPRRQVEIRTLTWWRASRPLYSKLHNDNVVVWFSVIEHKSIFEINVIPIATVSFVHFWVHCLLTVLLFFLLLIRNIVATVNLDCRLDLKTIALHARNAEYNPKVHIQC